jgi:hypothetical protein
MRYVTIPRWQVLTYAILNFVVFALIASSKYLVTEKGVWGHVEFWSFMGLALSGIFIHPTLRGEKGRDHRRTA